MVSTSCYRSAVVVIACHLPGRERALSLASRGYNVFRTAVFAEEVRDLEDASGARMSLIAFGVTKNRWHHDTGRRSIRRTGWRWTKCSFCIISRSSLGPTAGLPFEAISQELDSSVAGALSVMKAFFSDPLQFDRPSATSTKDRSHFQRLSRRTEKFRNRGSDLLCKYEEVNAETNRICSGSYGDRFRLVAMQKQHEP
ncbi:hypothetical protein WA845_23770 [Agrobacterium sp. CMT1]|uniref:hypothetical protein n=1 Tax=Agrobacterium sp. CMT1 TaxID=3128901 RepID=UPI003076B244